MTRGDVGGGDARVRPTKHRTPVALARRASRGRAATYVVEGAQRRAWDTRARVRYRR